MIENLSLDNFKCFNHVDIPFSKVNVFAGVNGMGKSTAIQALTLLRQTYEKGKLKDGLVLNGDIVVIGSGQDLRSLNSDNELIGISIKAAARNYNFHYQYENTDYLELKDRIDDSDYQSFIKEGLFNDNFCFLAAERMGPREIYNLSKYDVNILHKLGVNGENVVGYLLEQGNNDPGTETVKKSKNGHSLEAETNAWLNEISPQATISLKNYEAAHRVGLVYRTPSKYGYVDCNAINVGFGISYCLPIIVALLKAKKDDLVILENPEAHLHPAGQRKMGELIAAAAAGGVQIVVETHSDHLINGLRIAVKNKELEPNDVIFNFFCLQETGQEGEYEHQRLEPHIMEDGSLDEWPNGFFDEWDNEIEALF